jgi:DNA modification methylase
MPKTKTWQDNQPDNDNPEIWRNRIIRYADARVDELLANPFNLRIHGQAQQAYMLGVLKSVGIVDTICINETTGHLVDGHLRMVLADRHGIESLPARWIQVSEAEEAEILLTFDWITTLATYDRDNTDALLRMVQTSEPDVQTMLAGMAEAQGLYFGDDSSEEPVGDAEAQLNRAHELVDKFQVERGQVWIIDRHRLMCGDAYSEENRTLLLDGAIPDLLNTDPPYGISIVKPTGNGSTADSGGAKAFGSTGDNERKGKSAIAERNRGNGAERGHVQHGKPSKNQWSKSHPEWLVMEGDNVGRGNPANIVQSNIYPVIEGDDTPFEPAFLLDLAPIIVLWGANYYADKLPTSSGWIVWDKRENITRNNFADCELAWTNQGKPARIFYHLWNGLHKGSQHGERRVHPTEKPVALFREIGELLAPRGLWLDLFAGSGAQLVAAHESGATCYALEYEPLYVATILQRMTDLGYTPVKAE